LVAEGWTVRTTVRDLARESAVRKLLAVDNSRLAFFAADLTADTGWQQAMAGCTHLAHVASPFPRVHSKDPNDLIVPAREGALRALRAAKAAGVKRVVMTSSSAAIAYGHGRGERTFTEADWTNAAAPGVNAYMQSKTLAERAAREWVASEGGGMELCTINPTAVLGPVWSDDLSTSIDLVKKLLDGSMPGCPNLNIGIVDVRDVADMHVRALTAPNMAGERFVASGPTIGIIDIARILKERLGPQARKVPARRLPDFMVKLAAIFDPVIRQVTGDLGSVHHLDASHAGAVLGWSARPHQETIVDTARSLFDLGIVNA
jgi:dihydroflavonol-4-reductase